MKLTFAKSTNAVEAVALVAVVLAVALVAVSVLVLPPSLKISVDDDNVAIPLILLGLFHSVVLI